MAETSEIRLCGFGGQGIILAGFIIGKAATIYEKQFAIFTQDYGPEARGGSCRADIIISQKPIPYPYIDNPSILVAMSQEAFIKYAKINIKTIIIDRDLVKPPASFKKDVLLMPAHEIALGLGQLAVANVVMLGFLTATTKILSPEAVKESVLESVPRQMGVLNTNAFERGYAAGMQTGAIK
ncbi:MAG TPA: 2-oxoacid:acceptor oxidoreductase family protein [Dehalococcoidales bacterium]|nr:2-oxoacid:acceptor oxidoreductase family protein [Dehalococcoidales bacterium]